MRFASVMALVWIWWAANAAPAGAAPVIYYDLTTLCSTSVGVIEGDVQSVGKGQRDTLTEVKITGVFKGDFKPGQSITVVTPCPFRKDTLAPVGSSESATHPAPFVPVEHLKVCAGDHLFLLLASVSQPKIARDALPAQCFSPLEARLGEQGKAVRFSIESGVMYPLAAETPTEYSQTSEDFAAQLREDVSDATTIEAIGAHPTPAGTRQLLECLRRRAGRDTYEDTVPLAGMNSFLTDVFGVNATSHTLCVRLANNADPETLDEALRLSLSASDYNSVELGFGSPLGREFLLEKIADVHEMTPNRLLYAQALKTVGASYYRGIRDINSSCWGEVRYRSSIPEQKDNAGYMVRIVRLIGENATNEDLSVALTRMIGDFAIHVPSLLQPPLADDLHHALSELAVLRGKVKSPRLRAAMEDALLRRTLPQNTKGVITDATAKS